VADDEFVRIEVALEGGQILSWLVTAASADALDKALRSGDGAPTLALDAEDGSILLVLPHVQYAKRFAREGRVGFEV
jgi:hypothetical protein